MMAEQQTREALAVERDQLAANIIGWILLSPHSLLWSDLMEANIARYRALADEIARRGDPVQQSRLTGVA